MTKKPGNGFGNDVSRAPVSQRGQVVKPTDIDDAIGAKVTIEIDGKSVKVPVGTTIRDAARQIGIELPTLCHHEDLCVAGVCRVPTALYRVDD